VDSVAGRLSTVPRARLERTPLNNAALLARRTYAQDLDLFEELLRRNGGDLRVTIARTIRITANQRDAFASLRASLGAPPPLPAARDAPKR
jgi:hypothetical protein